MRRDSAAREARRLRAQERLAAHQPQSEPPAEPKYRTPDTVDDMLAFATELGWSYKRTSSGYRLTHPSGATASIHLTMSDVAAWRNLRSRLLKPIREASRV
jgi:hypothetical protein